MMKYMVIYTMQRSYRVEAEDEYAARKEADWQYAEDCHNVNLSGEAVVDVKKLGD